MEAVTAGASMLSPKQHDHDSKQIAVLKYALGAAFVALSLSIGFSIFLFLEISELKEELHRDDTYVKTVDFDSKFDEKSQDLQSQIDKQNLALNGDLRKLDSLTVLDNAINYQNAPSFSDGMYLFKDFKVINSKEITITTKSKLLIWSMNEVLVHYTIDGSSHKLLVNIRLASETPPTFDNKFLTVLSSGRDDLFAAAPAFTSRVLNEGTYTVVVEAADHLGSDIPTRNVNILHSNLFLLAIPIA